jgi:predicted RecB family nuclease
MKLIAKQIRLSATDLSSHLACRYVTTLDLSVARQQRDAPEWRAPDLAVIQELGERHEAAYLNFLRERRNMVLDLRSIVSEEKAVAATLESMQRGVEIIAQGALASGRWFGRTDVLQKVSKPSRFGEWSYEVYDCKLARETKATTILQLALYAALLREAQQSETEFMHVVPPGRAFEPESYRVSEYAAYYRYVLARLEKACENGEADLYPEPCAHCEVCRWFGECNARRRADDHLSLVAGIRRQQRVQLEQWKTETMAALAEMPIPLKDKPRFGSRAGMERVREQARIQVQGREEHKCLHEDLAVVAGSGFCLLPEPVDGDMFVDLEGDPFAGDVEAGGGQEYLFGFVAKDEEGKLRYEKRWALSKPEEKSGFEWLIDEVMGRWTKNPGMHVYHFGNYEKDHLKKLAGRYITREDEIDRMLRAHVMVDLHSVSKQAIRASVEEYSLKALEALYGFERKTALEESRVAMRYVEHRLELGWEGELPEKLREAMEGYNAEDCFSTAAMRDWLEAERAKSIAAGSQIERLALAAGDPPKDLDERQKRIAALFADLQSGIPLEGAERTPEQQAAWTLANLLDWHRRENKAGYWEGYRLEELDEEALRDERAGLAGLQFVKRVGTEGQIAVDRYSFDRQETEIRCGDQLFIARTRENVGEVVAIDLVKRVIDIKKPKKAKDLHPPCVYAWDRPYPADAQADALFRLGEWVRDHGVEADGPHRAGRDLLSRKPPRMADGETLAPLPLEETKETACRIAAALRESVFAIQGPPGAGKTFTGARMICRLVQAGKKVGVTALSHKVIRKLLDEVVEAASVDGISGVRCMQLRKSLPDDEVSPEIAAVKNNEGALQALSSGKANVVGGTSWLWARKQACGAVDALFVDEAGQMALADVAAVSQSAKNLFLIGDPQQLQRPLQGSHPEGAEKSALEHLIGERKTILPEMGMLLPQTWRMHPEVCRYTSEMFYDGKLGSRAVTGPRVLQGHPWLTKPGLYFVPVEHDGNRNSSAEEVEAVAKIVASLLKPGVVWFRSTGNSERLALDEVVIVAPYNAQVADIQAKIPGAFAGTVDKFQGQEAPVVIYSLTTSAPEDAPHGMEFLYSLNRLNVATSRAMSNVILVASPRLLEPECKNPRQMQLANALCRYKELATEINKL